LVRIRRLFVGMSCLCSIGVSPWSDGDPTGSLAEFGSSACLRATGRAREPARHLSCRRRSPDAWGPCAARHTRPAREGAGRGHFRDRLEATKIPAVAVAPDLLVHIGIGGGCRLRRVDGHDGVGVTLLQPEETLPADLERRQPEARRLLNLRKGGRVAADLVEPGPAGGYQRRRPGSLSEIEPRRGLRFRSPGEYTPKSVAQLLDL
jgi:hypothetical protein